MKMSNVPKYIIYIKVDLIFWTVGASFIGHIDLKGCLASYPLPSQTTTSPSLFQKYIRFKISGLLQEHNKLIFGITWLSVLQE